MKNTIIKLTALFSFGALALSGCDNFDEMNENKNALQTTNATSYVQPITFGLEYALLERSFDVNSQLMQYTVQAQTSAERIYNYRFNNSIINYFWQNIYRWAGNAETMRVQAEKDNDKTGLAIACILKVLTLSHITDAFGDAPYFEAGRGIPKASSTRPTTARRRFTATCSKNSNWPTNCWPKARISTPWRTTCTTERSPGGASSATRFTSAC